MISKHIKITEAQELASQKVHKETGETLSVTIRTLLTKYYRNKGLM